MDSNSMVLVGLALQSMLQAQAYQAAVVRANAENRDVTDAEVAEAKAKAMTAIEALAAQP